MDGMILPAFFVARHTWRRALPASIIAEKELHHAPRSKSNPLWLLVGSIVSEGNIMEPHRGGSTGRKMKKVSPEDLFGWLDEERFIDVKQPKKRRSTSAPPPPPTGRKTHVKTKNSKKSSEVAAGKELKRASKRCNASLNDTISRGPSAAVTNQSYFLYI